MITDYMIETTKREMAEIKAMRDKAFQDGEEYGMQFILNAMTASSRFKEGFKECFPDAKYVGERR